MKLHLESLGLSETSIWRKELIESRQTAEPALIEHTVTHLLDAAEEKLGQSSIPELLDSVNRALAHCPNDKRALRILNRLTNRQRLYRIGLGMLVAVGLTGGSQLALSHFDESNNESTSSPASIAFRTSSNATFNADIQFEPGTINALDVSVSMPTASSVDAQSPPSDASIEVVDIQDASLPQRSKKDSSSKTLTNASSRSKRLSPPRGSKIVSAKKTDVKSETTKNKGPLTTIQVSSELQGARIIVNGTLHPEKYLSRVRARGGLRLPPGKHRIEIENIGCKTEAYDRVVVAGQRVPAIFHECKWLDAYLRVNTIEGALEIRDRGDKNQRILGETNQRITMDMDAYRSRKQIMIRRADNSFMMLTINLTAGETTVVNAPADTSKVTMRCCTYLFFFVCLHGGYIYAGPAEELRDAENSYLYGDHDRVVRKIIPVIEPDLLLSDENKIARAYELVGLAAFFFWRIRKVLDDNSKSSFVYGTNFRLDPVKVPPPAISFFDQLRDELKDDIAPNQSSVAETRRRRGAQEAFSKSRQGKKRCQNQ